MKIESEGREREEEKKLKGMSVRVLCYLGIFDVSVMRFLNWGPFLVVV